MLLHSSFLDYITEEWSACEEQDQNGKVFVLAVLHNSAGSADAVISSLSNTADEIILGGFGTV